ncbi:MAG: hypothetical protein MZV70_22405 [Desulfobacterales bacterium]|nr:hypothetical protein [Desulfobacterales bacterium]
MDASGAYVPGTAERINLGSGTAGEPRLVDAGGKPGVVWFDNRRGSNRVYLAFREGILWRERDVSGAAQGEATFGRAVYRQGRLWAFWQAQPAYKKDEKPLPPRISILAPDTTVQAPAAGAADFAEGRRTRRDSASIRWTTPEDSSGIAGYSYSWSQNPDARPPEELMALETVNRAAFTADRDGSWWFAIRAVDYAGNWSAPVRVEFVRDTTPPGPPSLRPPEAGTDGFLSSNTFNVLWEPPADPDVAGYTWTLRFIGPLDRLPARKRPAAPAPASGDAAAAAGAATSSVPGLVGPLPLRARHGLREGAGRPGGRRGSAARFPGPGGFRGLPQRGRRVLHLLRGGHRRGRKHRSRSPDPPACGQVRALHPGVRRFGVPGRLRRGDPAGPGPGIPGGRRGVPYRPGPGRRGALRLRLQPLRGGLYRGLGPVPRGPGRPGRRGGSTGWGFSIPPGAGTGPGPPGLRRRGYGEVRRLFRPVRACVDLPSPGEVPDFLLGPLRGPGRGLRGRRHPCDPPSGPPPSYATAP